MFHEPYSTQSEVKANLHGSWRMTNSFMQQFLCFPFGVQLHSNRRATKQHKTRVTFKNKIWINISRSASFFPLVANDALSAASSNLVYLEMFEFSPNSTSNFHCCFSGRWKALAAENGTRAGNVKPTNLLPLRRPCIFTIPLWLAALCELSRFARGRPCE